MRQSTNQSTVTSIHAGLTLASGNGSLALTRVINGATQVVDYLNYVVATPGGTNNAALAPIAVFINEWLADNTVTLADPADGQFEDWFELYNSGTTL